METKRKSNKTVVKSIGRKKKDKSKSESEIEPIKDVVVKDVVVKDVVESSVEKISRLSVDHLVGYMDGIPVDRMNDVGYIHYHIFSVWFLSKMNIPVPNDMDIIYESHFKQFPFYSSVFHIRNNLAS